MRKRRIYSNIYMLIALVIAVVAFGTKVYAADIALGNYLAECNTSVDTNYGTIHEVKSTGSVACNEGMINFLSGTVVQNNAEIEEISLPGIVSTNKSKVNANYGKITVNSESGEITTNCGTVENNNGTIDTNAGTIDRMDKGTVNVNAAGYTISGFCGGEIKTNKGTVNYHPDIIGGKIGTNEERATISIQFTSLPSDGRRIEIDVNKGTLYLGNCYAKVGTNYGTIIMSNSTNLKCDNNYNEIKKSGEGVSYTLDCENNYGELPNPTDAKYYYYEINFTGLGESSNLSELTGVKSYNGKNFFKYSDEVVFKLNSAYGYKKENLIDEANNKYRIKIEQNHNFTVDCHKCTSNIVIDPRIEPTETTTGLTEGSHCGTCNRVLTAQTIIPQKSLVPTITPTPTKQPANTPNSDNEQDNNQEKKSSEKSNAQIIDNKVMSKVFSSVTKKADVENTDSIFTKLDVDETITDSTTDVSEVAEVGQQQEQNADEANAVSASDFSSSERENSSIVESKDNTSASHMSLAIAIIGSVAVAVGGAVFCVKKFRVKK